MMCHCRFMDYNKRTILVGNGDSGGSYVCMGIGVCGKSLNLPLNLAVNLKINEVFFFLQKKKKVTSFIEYLLSWLRSHYY